MAKSSALNREAFLVFRPELNGIQLQARRLNGTITGFGNKTRSIHRNVVMEMAQTAANRIDETTVRPTDMRSGRLKAAVANPQSHTSTDSGFVFLDFDAMYSQVIYWRLIERGTRQFVGRPRHFIFLSGKTGRPVKPNMRRRGQDTVFVDKEDPRSNRRLIKTPILAHEYAKYAIDQFARDDYADYKGRIMRAAADSGLPLVIA